MLITLSSWMVFALACFVWGWGMRRLVVAWGHGYKVEDLSAILMMGFVAATLYAETFSLFARVGGVACAGFLGIGAILLCCERKSIAVWVRGFLRKQKQCYGIVYWALLLALFGISLVLSSTVPDGFDTYNYHAPAIRWLEEFGIAKGLGNLHTRFAYNNSFLCLQALFSFAWTGCRSLHGINGFLWFYSVCFCLSGLLKKGCGWSLSNAFRVMLLWLTVASSFFIHYMSAPHTDWMPLLLTACIFIWWRELDERQERSMVPYCLLSLLGIFAVSVKLSAGIIALFALNPFWRFALERIWKKAVFFALACGIPLAPFVARNVVLSGYLLYPLPEVDVCRVDWKVPALTIRSERVAMQVFARAHGGNYAYSDIEKKPWQWGPEFFGRLSRFWQASLVVSVLTYLVFFAAWLVRLAGGSKRPQMDGAGLAAMGTLGLCYALMSAPAPRFGAWWFLAGCGFCLWYLGSWLEKNRPAGKSNGDSRLFRGCAWATMIGIFGCFGAELVEERPYWTPVLREALKLPYDYARPSPESPWLEKDGIRFYYAYECRQNVGPLNGYWGFPGTECREILEKIEMCESTLANGFRVKKEWKETPFDFRGNPLTAEEVRMITGQPAPSSDGQEDRETYKQTGI